MVRLVGLEIVDVVCHLDKEAVGQYSHSINDTKNGFADCAVNNREVGNIGGVGKVKLEAWCVEEGDLCCTNLVLASVCIRDGLRVEFAHTKGMTFVNGHKSTLIRPFM